MFGLVKQTKIKHIFDIKVLSVFQILFKFEVIWAQIDMMGNFFLAHLCFSSVKIHLLVLSPDLEVLRSFQNQIASIQRDAVWWLHTVVPTISKVGAKDYVHWWILMSQNLVLVWKNLSFKFPIFLLHSTAFTKCFSRSNPRPITSGTTGRQRATGSKLQMGVRWLGRTRLRCLSCSVVFSCASAPRCLCWRTRWCASLSSGCHAICRWVRRMPWSSPTTWLRGLLAYSLTVSSYHLTLEW